MTTMEQPAVAEYDETIAMLAQDAERHREAAQQQAQRIQREQGDPQALAYAFAGEEWDGALRRLPFSCLLWLRYREYDAARKAHAEALDTRNRWRQERGQWLRSLEAMTADPDTVDVDAYLHAEAKAKVLERALDDPHGQLAELLMAANQASDRWGRAWQDYTHAKRALAEQERRGVDLSSSGGYDDRGPVVRQILDALRSWGAPR